MNETLPMVNLIIPCRNEERYIGRCLDSLLANDYPQDRLDIIVADGRSEDRTAAIVAGYAERGCPVRLVDNPARITSAALNLGIRSSLGAVVMITGAHSEYPAHYIRVLVRSLLESGADGVGGRCEAVPGSETAVSKAIAIALSHPFGVGNSHFRIGALEPRWVDTVPFGCYRRDVFTCYGLFDEELVRNQDDEFNLRILRAGGRLLLVPAVSSRYYTRDRLSHVWRMFYQYGLFKPLVARKLGRIMTLRQLVPAMFVATVGLTGILAPWSLASRMLLGATLACYLATNVLVSIAAARGGRCNWLHLAGTFPVVHLGYGVGYLTGALRLLRPGWFSSPSSVDIPLSR